MEIAREAQSETSVASPIVFVAPTPELLVPCPSTTSTRGFAIVAGLTLSFGGIVVPFVVGGLSALLLSSMVTVLTWESSGSSSGAESPANNPLV